MLTPLPIVFVADVAPDPVVSGPVIAIIAVVVAVGAFFAWRHISRKDK